MLNGKHHENKYKSQNSSSLKDSDLLWAVFIIYSLQLSNVKVAHPLQTLQLCLDFGFFL